MKYKIASLILSLFIFEGCSNSTYNEKEERIASAGQFQEFDKYSCNEANMLVVERNVGVGVEVILNHLNEPIFCIKEKK